MNSESTIEINCDREPVSFTVIAGTPIPRFSAALTTSSSTVSVEPPDEYWATLEITSLEARPVTISPYFDRLFTLYPNEKRWRGDLEDPLDYFDVLEDDREIEVMQTPRERFDYSPVQCYTRDLIQFNQGTIYRRPIRFAQDMFCEMVPGPTYTITLQPLGFAAWDYGVASELEKSEEYQEANGWNRHGPIIFEPVSAAAVTIREILEREKPQPFFCAST